MLWLCELVVRVQKERLFLSSSYATRILEAPKIKKRFPKGQQNMPGENRPGNVKIRLTGIEMAGLPPLFGAFSAR
jgi:hypothetical protein